MNQDALTITEKDYLRISRLIEKLTPNNDELENLQVELDRANLIQDSEVPPDLVTMNSKVRFINLSNQKEQIVELVYPDYADLDSRKISVTASLGSALIGLTVGQEINWQFPDKVTRRLKILEVIYQPEANGDWHL